MKLNEKLNNHMITFKSTMIYFMFFAITIPILEGFFSNNFDILFFICLIVGLGISTPLTYYFINDKSFEPMPFANNIIMATINVLVAAVIALVAFLIIIGFQNVVM